MSDLEPLEMIYELKVRINADSDIQPRLISVEDQADVIEIHGIDTDRVRVETTDADLATIEARLEADPNVITWGEVS